MALYGSLQSRVRVCVLLVCIVFCVERAKRLTYKMTSAAAGVVVKTPKIFLRSVGVP